MDTYDKVISGKTAQKNYKRKWIIGGQKMLEYSVLIQYDPADKIYVASIPELQGCMAHGKTQQEAVSEVNVVKDMWIATAKEKGLQIPKPALFNSVAV